MSSPIPTPPPPFPGGDENRGHQVLIVLIVTFTSAFIPVCLRVWVRLRIAGFLGWDDYTIIGAMSVGVVGLIVNIPSVTNGFGRHIYYLSQEQIVAARMWSELSQLQNILGVWLLKLSIFIFLLRVLGRTHRNFTLFLWVLLGVSTVVNVSLVIIWFEQCTPLKAVWDFRLDHSKCLTKNAIVGVAYLTAGFNMATDIICAAFPIYFFRNIQINRGRKIALMVLTSFGFLTSVAAMLKIIFLQGLVESKDVTWAPVNVTICAIVEEYAGIFCAALPALKPLFSKALALTHYGRAKSNSNATRPSFARGYGGIDRFQSTTRTTVTTGSGQDEGILPGTGIIATTAYEVSIHTCTGEELGGLSQYGHNESRVSVELDRISLPPF